MKNKIKYNNKLFGTLLKAGDKVKLTNLWNEKLEPKFKTIQGFDGLEYKTSDNPYENIGHSGYIVESPTVFYICSSGEPIIKIEKRGV